MMIIIVASIAHFDVAENDLYMMDCPHLCCVKLCFPLYFHHIVLQPTLHCIE